MATAVGYIHENEVVLEMYEEYVEGEVVVEAVKEVWVEVVDKLLVEEGRVDKIAEVEEELHKEVGLHTAVDAVVVGCSMQVEEQSEQLLFQ